MLKRLLHRMYQRDRNTAYIYSRLSLLDRSRFSLFMLATLILLRSYSEISNGSNVLMTTMLSLLQ